MSYSRNESEDTASFGRRAPFTLAPDWVALSGVSNNAKVLFWHIAMHVNNTRGDHAAWPGRPVLARRMGYSRADKVDRYIRELIDLGAIECFEREREDGGQASNHYVVHETPPPGYTGPASLADAYAQEKTRANQGVSKVSAGQPPAPKRGRGGPSNGDGGEPPFEDGGEPSNGGPNKKKNNHKKNNHSSVRSVRTAQVGDARARATTPQAAREKPNGKTNGTNGSAVPAPRSPQTAEHAPGGQRDASAAERRPARRTASHSARRILGALPPALRDGAPAWVLAQMAVRIDAMLAEGHTPGAIVQAAEEISQGRTFGERGHIDALREVRAGVRANAVDPEADVTGRCDGCGARRTGTIPCLTCEPVEVLEVIDCAETAEALSTG